MRRTRPSTTTTTTTASRHSLPGVGAGTSASASAGSTSNANKNKNRNKRRATTNFGSGGGGLTSSSGGRARELGSDEERERAEKTANARRRRHRKRLDELERSNYRDAPSTLSFGHTNVGSVSSNNGTAATLAGILAGRASSPDGANGGDTSLSEFETPGAGAGAAGGGGGAGANKTANATGQNVQNITSKKRQSANVKRLLTYRRGLNALLDDATESGTFTVGPNYLTAAAPPSRYPARPLCTICGYWGSASCVRCGERYCGRACAETHDEARCERPF